VSCDQGIDTIIGAVADEVHGALVEVASVLELDRFQVLTEHAPVDLIYDATYLGVKRSDDIVMIQLVSVAPKDWSFGDGKAQYVKAET